MGVDMPATATLQATNTDKSVNYRLNLNIVASRVLDGVTYCEVIKTANFIVIKPMADDMKSPFKCTVCRVRGKYVGFSLMRFVGDGTIAKRYFKKKYKVKKDKHGWLYVCLNDEVIDDE